ncbi:hypothetical protein THAOC_04918 [Thalassiosira oceanica]|uniref:Uncharacterized protein n=1 Tax=Thalassiosira oceanica TaxID=159749 RepID=K0TNE6_THAOC|nr:hypothetical protein THAOC_04918 [Thalassiosira oceanica]|eukprot:EJK73457.1 hypothetical protein THAOC_04918 [Thalassiosira oceanica]
MTRYVPALDEYVRKTRKDKIPLEWIDIIDNFWRAHNHTSPNKKDIAILRHPDYPRQVKTAPKIYQTKTDNELWSDFQQLHPSIADKIKNPNLPDKCPRVLAKHKPWEMTKAKNSSCHCSKCEGMSAFLRGESTAISLLHSMMDRVEEHVRELDVEEDENEISRCNRGVRQLRSICDVLTQPSKREKCVECMKPCLVSGKIEDAKESCVTGECQSCGLRNLWQLGVRRQLFRQEIGQDPILHVSSPFYGEELTETFEWRYYSQKRSPTLSTHAQQVAEDDDEEYSPTASASRSLTLETKRGTLIDYLDELVEKMARFIPHKNLVAVEERAKLNFGRNLRPLVCVNDIDFSENGSIENFRKLQSEHWLTNGYTLFISVTYWIVAEEWDKEEGKLPKGAEVTVYGEKSGESINKNSFWGIVTEEIDGGARYKVEDAEGRVATYERKDLRHRTTHTFCFGTVSDDKTHDRFAMQHYTKTELEYLENYMRQHFPKDLIDGKIAKLFRHSDNAGQHFKNTGAIHYFTTLILERGGPTKTGYVYTFGAPGHGKGPFDGYGGSFKNKIHSLIRSCSEAGGIPGTRTGYINEARDVFDALVHYYEKGIGRQAKTGAKTDNFKFFLSEIGTETAVPRADEEFVTLNNITKQYQFAVNNEGLLFVRRRSCWCLACMAALLEGTLRWPDEKQIAGCETVALGGQGLMYRFYKEPARKVRGAGASRTITLDRRTRFDKAKSLAVGDWVIFDGNGDVDNPRWLGRVMSYADWGGQGVELNESNRSKYYQNGHLEIGSNEVAINLMWYEKIDVESPELTYRVSQDYPQAVLQSNTYMVSGGAEVNDGMNLIDGAANPVPKLRTTRRRDGRSQQGDYDVQRGNSNQRTIRNWYDREYNNKWQMEKTVMDKAMAINLV